MEPKLIKGFPNYRIHPCGKVESRYRPKTSIPTDTWREVQHVVDRASTGYMLVTLCHGGVRKNKRIHRLLMETFVPNPENKAQVNHKDGNKVNNCLSNLEWATPKENSQHAVDIGLNQKAIDASKVQVLQYLPDKVTLVATHPSLHDAERNVPSAAWQNIWKVCNGHRHTAGGFHWKYKKV